MQRNTFEVLKGMLFLVFSLWMGTIIGQTTYYVSNTGNDANNGTSISTPWKTCARVVSQDLQPGDYVLFKAGEKWREEWYINDAGSKGNLIHFGRYGTGKNPRFLGSTKAITWTATSVPNVWQTATSLTNYSDDFYACGLFVCFKKNSKDTIGYGDYKVYTSNFSNLTQEFDYCVNGTTHYLYSQTDPDIRYDSIEVNQRERVISLRNYESYLEFNGLDIMFGRRSGFWSGYPEPRGATDLIFRNCFIGYTGAKGSGSAYGLACFHSNTLIEKCSFSDNGRRAISINTYTDNPGGRRIQNIIIRNNTFKRGYHTTSLDLSTMNRTGDTVMNVYFYNNIVDDSEIDEIGSWGSSNQLFTQAGIGTSLMTNIYIVGNLFSGATSRSILLENSITHFIWNNSITGFNLIRTTSPYGSLGLGGADTVDLRNNIFYDNFGANSIENNLVHGYNAGNVYFPHRDYNLYYTQYPGSNRNFTSIEVNDVNSFFNTNQWSSYLSKFPAYDQHSPAPQNPNFINYAARNFRLSTTSPAIGKGGFPGYVLVTDPLGVVDTINKNDIDGKEYNVSLWDLGAYAYSTASSSAANITSFTLAAQTGAATINATNRTVNIQVAYGTSLTSLIPTIGISPSASINPATGVARNFTSPVTYTVTAQNGTTKQWTVTVSIKPSSGANITSFSLASQTGAATINATNRTVNIQVAYGTSLTSLIPAIGISSSASINPTTGVARNFTSPVTYTVTAQDGTTQQWTVTVTVKPSSEANITSFSLTSQTGAATINTTNRTVNIQVAYGTSITSLIPTIGISSSASINPATGVARNFTSPVTYTVTAQDGSTQKVWTISVTKAAQSGNNVPVVNVEYQTSVIKGLVYSLDASSSYDLDNQTLSFNWVVPAEISASSLTGSKISILPTEKTVEKVYTVKLTVSDGIASVVRNLDISVSGFNIDAKELSIKSIVASNYEIGNEPGKIVDNNLTTRWSADGDNQFLVFELTEPSTLSHFLLAFHEGKTRTSYFDIYTSSDNITWDLIQNRRASCGFSSNMQMFEMLSSKASNPYKFIKLVGHMNSKNTWNSYTEFKAFGNLANLKDATSANLDANINDYMEVYPNPATDEVYLKAEVGSFVRIIDLSGATIYEQNIINEISRIDYTFKSGVYYVQLLSNNKIYTQKLIVK